MNTVVRFFVNGQPVECRADEADMSLLDFLHERLEQTGTKYSCGIGICRSCTVATRNRMGERLEKTLACATPVSGLQGKYVYTVEGLGNEQKLVPLQQAFLDHFSFQCGYCTPGFLMAATAMLDHMQQTPVSKAGLDAFIMHWVGDNICRCTGYVRYLEAIRQVALPFTHG